MRRRTPIIAATAAVALAVATGAYAATTTYDVPKFASAYPPHATSLVASSSVFAFDVYPTQQGTARIWYYTNGSGVWSNHLLNVAGVPLGIEGGYLAVSVG